MRSRTSGTATFAISNSLTPGYGKTDWHAIMRALIKTGYQGYCTIESAPMVPSSDRSAEDGIACLRLAERVAEYQVSAEYPNGYAIPGATW